MGPESKKHGGKLYLAHEDVEVELEGVGASVSFFVYADGNGLGAMNVRPATALKTPATPAQKFKTAATAAVATSTLKNLQTKLKATAKVAAAKKATTTLKGPQKPGGKKASGPKLAKERVTTDAVTGEVVSFKGKFGWIKLTEEVDEVEEDKDLYCAKEDVAEGTSLEPGTAILCHVYKDSKGFGVEDVCEA